MNILITGSRGFVGGSFGRYAHEAGHEVLGVARASQPDSDWPGRYVAADVAYADVASIVDEFEPDVVFHAAGTSSVGGSVAAPMDDLRAALLTWANVLDGVRRSNRRPLVIFPSSAAVYGNPDELPVREQSPTAPISPYGFHKAACELIGREYAECFGLDILVARVFSLYGAAQRRLLVWELTEQFLRAADSVVWLQGTGDETRDYLCVDDLAHALLQVSHARRAGRRVASFDCMNFASGRQVTTLEVAERIRGLLGSEKEIRCRGHLRRGDPKRWEADVTRLRGAASHWEPRSLAVGLSHCLRVWGSRPMVDKLLVSILAEHEATSPSSGLP